VWRRFQGQRLAAQSSHARWAQRFVSRRRGNEKRKPSEELNGLSKTMNVTIVGPSLRVVGGQAVQADLLLRHWKGDSDLEARFVAIDPPFPRLLGWVRSIRFMRTLARFPLFLSEVWRGTASADIVHIFSASYLSFLLGPVPAWIVARLRGKKCIINYRSGEAPDHLRRSAIARTVLGRVDGIVVPSRYLFDVFRQYGLSATVVPNIVDLTQC